jgi:hypothetical protein
MIETYGSTSTQSSTVLEDPPSHFASLLASITPHSLVSLAIRVRYKGNRHKEGIQDHQCSLIRPLKYGSFNILYTVEFADGVKWLVRIPNPGGNGRFTLSNVRCLRSEVYTMAFLRCNTSIPIPETYDFDETIDNEIGAPYVVMEFVEGLSVDELWFDHTGPTPLPVRRVRHILETLVQAMSELRKFQFDNIGSLQFEPDSILNPANYYR